MARLMEIILLGVSEGVTPSGLGKTGTIRSYNHFIPSGLDLCKWSKA